MAESGDQRVLVVDDDEWRRRGLLTGLESLGGVVSGCVGTRIDEVAAWDRSADVALVLLSGHQAGAHWDTLGGIMAAPCIRAATSAPIVLLLEDDDSPLAALRAFEAGIDFVYRRSQVATLDDLEAIVLAPSLAHDSRSQLDFNALARWGVTAHSRLNAGLHMIESNDWLALFGPGDSSVFSRRQTITIRERLTAAMRIRGTHALSAAQVEASLPSWKELRALVDEARGASTRA